MLCSSVLKHWTRKTALVREYNANRCAIARIKQKHYLRVYPTVLIYADGSTSTIRYHEPRNILKIPIIYEDLTSEAEKQAFMARRRPKETVKFKQDSTDVKFDATKYLKYVKKK